MGVTKRCEIKRHEPFTGDGCPECEKVQRNGQFAGWLVISLIMSAGAVAWFLLAKKFPW